MLETETKIKDGYFKIRPAGRHIITIGRDLIKDKYAAIVELVKNSYDADSPICKVSLLPFSKEIIVDGESIIQKGIKIIVKDEGHGMDFSTVVEKWMVPSTDDKLNRKTSPDGRIMQGRKGVGRFAASMIGDDLVLQTIDKNGELTTLYLIWDEFEKAQYLEDVNVLIENFTTERPSGTELIIVGDDYHLNQWNIKQLQNLKFELKKLIPPVGNSEHTIGTDKNKFKIQLELGDFGIDKYSNEIEDIEPYPLFDLYDYRISGTVSPVGVAKLKFENKRVKDSPIEDVKEFQIIFNQNQYRKGDESPCGLLNVDFRVFDRDPISIDGLIERGLKDQVTGEYVGKREARLILDSFNGIGVYRNGFRIRPLGDAGYDWLELDRERVQNPSMKIGSDQIIGFIHIQSEEESGLEEKSARDGLKETQEYFGLQEICKQILIKLEERRFNYRQNVGLGRSNRDINEKINTLYNFKDLKDKINSELETLGIDTQRRAKINIIINEKEQKSNKIADELKQAIALYQGQATVGKIVNVILHEGRKPLGYFKNQIPLITVWGEELQQDYNVELLNKIVNRLGVVSEQSDILIKLFAKLDPLSAKRRDRKKDFYIKNVIENVKNVFLNELNDANIKYTIDCNNDLSIYGWQEDFYIVLTNLVDNSLYWFQAVSDRDKEIKIKAWEDENIIYIEYRDNGPGIDKNLIETEIIFEPEFSNKTGGGTGLGLAISGEAVERNNGELKAIFSETGAYFKIEIPIQ